MSENNMDKNMQDLVNAAKIKLQQQSEEVNETDSSEDIYASMREEMDLPDEEIQEENPTISRTGYYEEEFNKIQYAPDDYDDYQIDLDDTEVFPGGPGISQVNLWKKQFLKERIYHTQIIERHFIFRTLNRFEYKQIVAHENLDPLRREELICQTATLWPYNYDFKAMAADDSGYPSTLAQIIMENSGFTKEYGIEIL